MADDSILTGTKKPLGLDEDYTVYDPDIMMHIIPRYPFVIFRSDINGTAPAVVATTLKEVIPDSDILHGS